MSMTEEDELLPESLQKLGLRPEPEASGAEAGCSIEEVTGETSLAAMLPGNRLQMNPFYGKDLHMFQSTNPERRPADEEESPLTTVANNLLIPSSSLENNNVLQTENKQQQNHWLFLFKDNSSNFQRPPCNYCTPSSNSPAEASTSVAEDPDAIPIEEVPNCNCANNKNLFRRKENSLDEIFHRKKTLFRSCLEKADRKWTFFNGKPSHVIINRRFKSNLRSSLLREPVLKLNKLEIEFREDTLTRRLTFSEVQTRYRATNPLQTSSASSSGDVFDLQLLNPQSFLLEESKSRLLPICSTPGTTTTDEEATPSTSSAGVASGAGSTGTGGVQQQQQLATCSQQAARLNNCDVTMDELASYFETFVHIPKKMSSMAEMMYT